MRVVISLGLTHHDQADGMPEPVERSSSLVAQLFFQSLTYLEGPSGGDPERALLCKKLRILWVIDGPNVEFINTALSHCRQKLFGHHFAITLRAQTIGVQSANFDRPVQGRYLQVEVLSEVNGEAWASAADIGVIGK